MLPDALGVVSNPCPAQLKGIAATDDTVRIINPERRWTPTSSGDGFGEYDLERARTLALAELARPVITHVSSGAITRQDRFSPG